MKIENEFFVEDIDVANFPYPKVEVRAWSLLSGGESGQIGTFEIQTNERSSGVRITLYKEKVFRGDDQTQIRKRLQEMADGWNKNLRDNWRNELKRCFKKLAEYEIRQLGEVNKHKENLAKYEKALDILTIS